MLLFVQLDLAFDQYAPLKVERAESLPPAVGLELFCREQHRAEVADERVGELVLLLWAAVHLEGEDDLRSGGEVWRGGVTRNT